MWAMFSTKRWLYNVTGLLAFVVLIGGCKKLKSEDKTSGIKVTNGITEDGFPYVVEIKMTVPGGVATCTGSFLSDSVLITAAHCMEGASDVSYGNATIGRQDIFVHPLWKESQQACNAEVNRGADIALVRFPNKTYRGLDYAVFSTSYPRVNDQLKIIGYGHNQFHLLDRYCYLPGSVDSVSGKCQVVAGNLEKDLSYSYVVIHEFDPSSHQSWSAESCSAICDDSALIGALEFQKVGFQDFVKSNCDGNFQNLNYSQTGAGTKRTGTNRISNIENGLIQFFGKPFGAGNGEYVATGSGDSGGPLFIQDKEHQWRLTGLTSGGALIRVPRQDTQGTSLPAGYTERSTYVDLTIKQNVDWIIQISSENQLNIPQVINGKRNN